MVLDTHMQKSGSKHRPYTCYKNKLKMNRRPKCKSQNYKIPRRKLAKT